MESELSQNLLVFQDRLGVHFRNKNLLIESLSHSSKGGQNYERLEFLGDRILGLVVAEIVFKTFPDDSEGGLAKRHAALASTETLAAIARDLGIPDIVLLSDGERMAGGQWQENLLADCLEAIIGALYLDQGLPACYDVIAGLWGEKIHILKEPPLDPKTGLQEWAQARKLPVPLYEIIKREGPDHAPIFSVQVSLPHFPAQIGVGSSRKIAEKEAAKLLLSYVETHHWHDMP